MTQDEIIRSPIGREQLVALAREAGFTDYYPERLTRFAALVAAHEREACAKVCEELHNGSLQEFGALVGEIYNEDCAAAIRNRSNT